MPIPVNKEIKQVSYNGTNIPIQNPSTGNINITTTAQTDVKNYATAQIVDANLTAANIAKDVVVLGITGTHQGGSKPEETFTVTPKVTSQTITPTSGSVFSSGTVNALYEEVSSSATMDANLRDSANIGKMYKYTGTSTSSYLNGGLYIFSQKPSGPLCFTALENSTISLENYGTLGDIYYSSSGSNWSNYIPSTTLNLTTGEKIYFKSTINYGTTMGNHKFYMTGSIAASGNVMSLIAGDNYESATTITDSYAFYGLFNDCQSLVTAPELPATILADSCYYRMFSNCTSLTTPPSLPATTLATSCYASMFAGCTALTTVPSLPATNFPTEDSDQYDTMFYNCTSLQVSDTQTEAAPYEWRIPMSGTFSGATTQAYVFFGCLGTRASDDIDITAGQYCTKYTQNSPV